MRITSQRKIMAAFAAAAFCTSAIAAPMVLRASHQFPGGKGDVRDDMMEPGPVSAAVAHGLLQRVRAAAGDHDRVSVPAESQGRGAADAGASAGDYRDSAWHSAGT